MDRDLTPERFVELVVQETQAMLEKHQIAAEQVLGLGIGAVGPLDPEARHYPAAGLFPVRSVEQRADLPYAGGTASY